MQGNAVSGLHVENNLQIITKSENASKNKSFMPGQRIPAGGIRKARALLRKIQKEAA
jgi:hypothetical protein